MLEPVHISLPDTLPDDKRCGHFIAERIHTPTHVLIGFGSDTGVRRNGGRPGAAIAPDLIRAALYRYTPDPVYVEQHAHVLRQTLDVGNIACTGRLEEDQAALGREVAAWLEKGVRPVILGGGHETSFGHFLGYVGANRSVNIINVDAHADVRPLKNGQAHSGSPFRQAIEHPASPCTSYAVYGLARWSTAKAHIDYLVSHDSKYYWDDETDAAKFESEFAALEDTTMVSIDMDVVKASEAPGVSAPASVGLPLESVLQASFLAGRSRKVHSFDIVEVNPFFDIDSLTTKAAALCVWQFLRGAAEIR